MNALIRKEIRLLLPAWIAALALAVVATWWFLSQHPSVSDTALLCLFGLGMLLLGLAPFGREFSQGTFSLLLSQPASRPRIWNTKITLLGAAMLSVWFLSPYGWRLFLGTYLGWGDAELPVTVGGILLAAFAGGLWTTVLFRQVTAAFWFTLLVPAALVLGTLQLADWLGMQYVMHVPDGKMYEGSMVAAVGVVLILYSIAGYWFARRLFLRAQDTAWTGGEVSLRFFHRRTAEVTLPDDAPRRQPLRALLWKEFQLHSISLFFAGGVLLLHLAAIGVRKAGDVLPPIWLDAARLIWVFWFVLPFILGATAVASERQFGTMDGQLCLPARRRTQFAIKLLLVLVAGVLLGAVMPWLLEHLAGLLGTGSDLLAGAYANPFGTYHLYDSSNTNRLLWLSIFATGLASVSFYASTLTRNALQALGAAVMCCAVVWGMAALSPWPEEIVSTRLWRGWLIYFTGAPTLFLVLVALAYWNFKRLHLTGQMWRRNLAVLVAWLVLVVCGTTAVYHRAWEFAMQLEPPAGPPRLSGPVRPVLIKTTTSARTFVLLPDGRLWSHRELDLVPIPDAHAQTNPALPELSPFQVIKTPHSEFIGGSNWIALAPLWCEFFLLQSEGLLWNATRWESVDADGHAEPAHCYNWDQKGRKRRPTEVNLSRFGTDSDWMALASGSSHFIALKRNGTIWGWGENRNHQLGDDSNAVTNAPVRIGTDSDWAAVFAGPGHSFAVKRDGVLWRWGKYATDAFRNNFENGPLKLDFKARGVRFIASNSDFDLILDTEGHLWGLGLIPQGVLGHDSAYDAHVSPVRLGSQIWSAASPSGWAGIAGLQSDGTLWVQRQDEFDSRRVHSLTEIGRRSDWLAINTEWDTILALAKDGTLCMFGDPNRRYDALLAPTRRARWSLNILERVKPGASFKAKNPGEAQHEPRTPEAIFLASRSLMKSQP